MTKWKCGNSFIPSQLAKNGMLLYIIYIEVYTGMHETDETSTNYLHEGSVDENS